MKKKYLVIIGIITKFIVIVVAAVALSYKNNLDNRTKASVVVGTADNDSKIWTLNDQFKDNLGYDSTLVAIDSRGAHPISTANKFLNPSFGSNNSSWSVSPILPSGYVLVPGNTIYGTSDFLAMKYEAKCAATSSLTTGLTTPADAGYNVYKDSDKTCTSANGKQVVSLPAGYPITYINQTDAISRCASVTLKAGSAHLITNDEWMTIARNAEQVNTNWSLGTVGSGYLYAGHNDNSPAKARIASSNDANRSAYTDASGTTEALTTATNKANGQSGTVGNQVRTFNLSNGQVIWDIAGNVYEWNNNTILGKDQPPSTNGRTPPLDSTFVAPSPGFKWREFTSLAPDNTYGYGTLTYDKVRPLSRTYDSKFGVGQIYSDGTTTNNTSYGFLRGGDWTNTSGTGAFAVSLGSTPGSRGSGLGFRCTSDPVAILQSYSSSSGVLVGGGNSVSIGSVSDGKITQNVNVGDTGTYNFTAYVYDNTTSHIAGALSSDGTTSTIAQLWYNGAVLATTYTDATVAKGAGWWKLSGSLTGANALREYGVLVKSGKTVIVDDFTLAKQSNYSVFLKSSYTNSDLNKWNRFCDGYIVASVCTRAATKSEAVSIKYQLCADDGSVCEANSTWKYWNNGAWVTATNSINQANQYIDLTQDAMNTFPTASKKLSFKIFFTFEGESGSTNFPKIGMVSVGLTTGTQGPGSTTSSSFSTSSSSSSNNTSNDVVTTSSNSSVNPNIHSSCIPYDLDNNSRVDIMDFAKWRPCYQKRGASDIASSSCGFADLVKDDWVNISDFAYLVVAITNYRTTSNKACVK